MTINISIQDVGQNLHPKITVLGVGGSGGNAVKFGDMTINSAYRNCANSPTRAIAGGGQTPHIGSTVIDMVEIATEGNAVDFGDLRQNQHLSGASFSNAHGGL